MINHVINRSFIISNWSFVVWFIFKEVVRGEIFLPFPNCDISFLCEIPAIGTKFQRSEVMGLTSQKGIFRSHRGDENYPIKLWFDFRDE